MIDLRKTGDLWQITLNRPDKANALTREMLAGLRDHLRDAQGKAACVVLTGAGKVFSAGADLDAVKAGLAIDPVWEEASQAMAALDCLTICALNGSLAGGAFGVALAADLRVSVTTAKFFYPVARLGFLPQPSDPARLARLVGSSRAKLILLGGAKLTAEEALAIGLVDRLCTREDLDGMVQELAAPAMAADPAHLAAIKRMIPG